MSTDYLPAFTTLFLPAFPLPTWKCPQSCLDHVFLTGPPQMLLGRTKLAPSSSALFICLKLPFYSVPNLVLSQPFVSESPPYACRSSHGQRKWYLIHDFILPSLLSTEPSRRCLSVCGIQCTELKSASMCPDL